jgi:hypothetical protein
VERGIPGNVLKLEVYPIVTAFVLPRAKLPNVDNSHENKRVYNLRCLVDVVRRGEWWWMTDILLPLGLESALSGCLDPIRVSCG